MTSAIVILDCETTGLSLSADDIWEFAGLRREPDGTENEMHLFIQHDLTKCHKLPPSFRADHQKRWPGPGGAIAPDHAAALIDGFIRPGRPHVVGAVPNFDTERLTALLGRHLGTGWSWPAHYHLIDVENLAVGFLRGRNPRRPLHPPWDSDELSEALGVEVIEEERHTALGDVRWALRIYDRIMGVNK